MRKEIKFLADMGVSPRCVEWLRTQGYDAIHLYEQRLQKLADSNILFKAEQEGRILLTMDLDFAQLLSNVISNNLPTVVIFRLSDQRPSNVQNKLEIILPILLNCEDGSSFIISVSDHKIRMRHLPIN
jgi:predicted nuclease of predicted toxin-antitoxin system